MTQREARSERTEKSSPPNLVPADFAAMGKKRMNEWVNAQSDLLNKLQETNRQWFERMQSEARLASEFASKLTAARSIPDAMTACQEWTNRRFELMTEDSKHLLADTQKFIETGARLMYNGSLSSRSDAGA